MNIFRSVISPRNPYLWILTFTFFISQFSYAQLCPPNLDFEFGNFTNWECKNGHVFGNSGENQVFWDQNDGEILDRQTMIGPGSTELDPHGLFPIQCPNGSGYSIKLGNEMGGHEAEGVFFTYTIPASVTDFAIIYNYAVVLQDPGHLPHQQPRFRARVVDAFSGEEIDCVSFDFTASASLPGFQPSATTSGVYFKDWTPVTVDLSNYAGRTIRLEFITSDCVFQEHFGYAYIDVNSGCNGSIGGSFHCEGDPYVNLTAPFGFQSYQWFSDNTFSNTIGTSQSLTIMPVPPVGATFPVIVTPFPGFGCADTLYAVIRTARKPVSIAGPDLNVCSKERFQLGGPPLPGHSYTWNNSTLLTNSAIANPFSKQNLLVPTEFIVRTTDLVTGCFSQDTTVITPRMVDTATTMTGRSAFCPGETFDVSLRVSNPSTTVQWHSGAAPIPGATNHIFNPASPGIYWARITQNGCNDTSRFYQIRFAPQPKASFTMERDVVCLTNPTTFTNTSTISSNESLSLAWYFSDNTTSNLNTVSKLFSDLGYQTVKLVATSTANCRDSVEKTVLVLKDCIPLVPSAFTPNNDGLNDVLKPNLAGIRQLKNFSIYNRYGNLVFTTKQEGVGWNGKKDGVLLDSGVFVWMLQYISFEGEEITLKGTVTLIR